MCIHIYIYIDNPPPLYSQLAWLSPAFTLTLLLGVSGLPLVEAAGRKKWGGQPEYDHYVKYTSAVVPWWPAPERVASADKDN